jgi:hypothetical protein
MCMTSNQRKPIGLTVILLISLFSLQAQTNIPKYEIGASIGSFVYMGDLTPSRFGSFRTARVGVTLHGSKVLSPSFLLRLNLAIGGLRGDDAAYDHPEYRQQRAFTFRSRVIELTPMLVWNPLRSNYSDKGLSPYLFGGAGLNFVRIRRDWSRFNAEYFDEDLNARLAQDIDHSLPRVMPVVPVGIGVRYGVSPRLAVNAEAAYRFTFTDYLDGFSQAANPDRKDNYHTISVGAIYRIGKKNTMDCPVVKY